MKLALKVAMATMAMAAASPSSATIVMGSLTGGSAKTAGGNFNVINPPAAIGNDNFNNFNVRAFNETQNFRLTEALNVDPGGVPDIAAGTVISSYYVNFDPENAETVSGTITFSSNVLGLIFMRPALNQSDYLGAPTTSYQMPNLRGFESADSATFSGRTVTFSLNASSPGDSFRVITAGVPEPATWAMMLLGFGAVGYGMRRRPKTATRVNWA